MSVEGASREQHASTAGKHLTCPLLNAATVSGTSSEALGEVLFKVYDFNSGTNFLVDTGSQISILPASTWDKGNRERTQGLWRQMGRRLPPSVGDF